jgi:WD40 repeat protein
VTRSGTVVQKWDVRTGRRTAQADLRDLIDGVSAKSILMTFSYPKPGHLGVVVWGDPRIHILDTATWHEVKTIKTGPDTSAIQFDQTGEHFVVNRRGGNIELWQSSPPRKRIGPIFTSDANVQRFVPRFLRDGRFMLAAGTSVRIYDVGAGKSKDTYTFGVPSGDVFEWYSFLDTSADGRTLMFRDDEVLETPYRIIRLDADLWIRQLCRMTGYREFTAAERESLGVSVPEEPLCHDG